MPELSISCAEKPCSTKADRASNTNLRGSNIIAGEDAVATVLRFGGHAVLSIRRSRAVVATTGGADASPSATVALEIQCNKGLITYRKRNDGRNSQINDHKDTSCKR